MSRTVRIILISVAGVVGAGVLAVVGLLILGLALTAGDPGPVASPAPSAAAKPDKTSQPAQTAPAPKAPAPAATKAPAAKPKPKPEPKLNANGQAVAPGAETAVLVSQDVLNRISVLTDCAELQEGFDVAAESFDLAEPGTVRSAQATEFMVAGDKRMRAVGCY